MKLLALAALALIVAIPALAAEATAPTEGLAQKVEMQGLAQQVSTLEAQVTSATARLFKIKECHSQGDFFRPLPDGTEGCVQAYPH